MSIDRQRVSRRDKAVLAELFETLAESKGSWREKPLTAFAALKGSEDPCLLMVIGRAVNGWRKDKWFADDIKIPDKRSEILDDTFIPTTWHDNEPMRWVDLGWGARDRYNTKRSAFWRVIQASAKQLGIDDIAKICWTNLYRVSPHSTGNPSSRLAAAQFDHCLQMLKIEIEDWNPRRLLFLTGYSWAKPFLEGLGWEPDFKVHNAAVEAAGSAPDGTRIVVAPHPQGKPQNKLVSAIIEAYNPT
ncbi:MAG: hypothetical protein O3A93_00840 [Chloroflexi bacterium]|nr:hypothetical protein [Chloroflexota bacterium]MDA1269794.1 hypothetical protein [Chloroflexota bacterium]